MCENNGPRCSRFGDLSIENIEESISNVVPANTVKTKASVWQQFSEFCKQRHYDLLSTTNPEEIAKILQDWAFNMKKKNGENYKETSVKSIWNTTALMVQEKYFKDYGIKINPFSDICFKQARNARDAKRKLLQENSEARKVSAKALTLHEIRAMANSWNEENPEGLQRKFFHVCSFELAWRGNEAVNCKVHFFQDEIDNEGQFTGRVEYNPVFSKTAQGGSKALASSKWLVRNRENESLCPVRLLKKLLEKRSLNVTSDRLFLTVNPAWEKSSWYKNSPIGLNTLSKWTKESALKIGLDAKRVKITNHSHRSSAISTLAKNGVGEQQLIKLTGHASAQSLKPYLQLDPDHHGSLIQNLRGNSEGNRNDSSKQEECKELQGLQTVKNQGQNVHYHNCSFHIVNNNAK